MTAEERYSQCNSLEELRAVYTKDRYGSDSWEYLRAIERAFIKHYRRLMENSS